MDSAIKCFVLLAAGIFLLVSHVNAQDEVDLPGKAFYLTDQVFKKMEKKTGLLNSRLDREANRYLKTLEKREKKLKRLLARKDSAAAARIFSNNSLQYAQFRTGISRTSTRASNAARGYIPRLDSLQTALRFLKMSPGGLTELSENGASLTNALGQINGLQDRFNKAEELKTYITNRRLFLEEQLNRYKLGNHLRKCRKQVYYYKAQVEEYRHMFEDPHNVEAKVLQLVSKTAFFKNFFSSHSQLASLFNLPGGQTASPLASFAGLQTRSSVQQDLLQRFGSSPNLSQFAQQQPAQFAQNERGRLRNRVSEIGGKNSDAEMPGFLPNNQKTKRFMNRLEFGSNLQTVKGNDFFPSTSDIGLSVGYKLNDKSIAGIGSSYKMGWGRSRRQVKFTHEGIGLRSFVDYRIKGNFWISGGAEMNYRSRFNNFEVLKDYSPWQKSALVGVSRKYKVNQKLKGNVQLMYDFLWKEQVPRAQQVVFRVGYSL